MQTTSWSSFIREQNISPVSLRDLQDAPDSWMCDLSQWGVLSITGVDALDFLQGQISCDVSLVKHESIQLAACINLKGRIISNFFVYKKGDDDYCLFCPPGTLAITTKVLKKYAIFSKVTILEEQSFALAAGSMIDTGHEQQIRQLTLSGTKFNLYFAPDDVMQKLWLELRKKDLILDSGYFDYQLIQHALVFIQSSSSGLFTPQEVNFELVDGINFTKGCYTGQEVIARLHYRGTPKRRAYIAEINVKADINVPDEIRDPEGKAQGHVLQSFSTESNTFALISLSLKSFENYDENPDLHRLNTSENTYFSCINAPHYSLSPG